MKRHRPKGRDYGPTGVGKLHSRPARVAGRTGDASPTTPSRRASGTVPSVGYSSAIRRVPGVCRQAKPLTRNCSQASGPRSAAPVSGGKPSTLAFPLASPTPGPRPGPGPGSSTRTCTRTCTPHPQPGPTPAARGRHQQQGPRQHRGPTPAAGPTPAPAPPLSFPALDYATSMQALRASFGVTPRDKRNHRRVADPPGRSRRPRRRTHRPQRPVHRSHRSRRHAPLAGPAMRRRTSKVSPSISHPGTVYVRSDNPLPTGDDARDPACQHPPRLPKRGGRGTQRRHYRAPGHTSRPSRWHDGE